MDTISIKQNKGNLCFPGRSSMLSLAAALLCSMGGAIPCHAVSQPSTSPLEATQNITKVTGTVISEEDGEPVIGAHVAVDGTKIAVITDSDGKFTLTNVPATAKKITVSFLGMNSRTVDIAPVVNVTLASSTESLDEVLVVAYGTAKKSTFTG